MNKILKLTLFISLIFLFHFPDLEAQIMPCASITVETFPLNPQSGDHNYFGVKVTLDKTYSQNVTVNGFIYDAGNGYNENNPFTLTVTSGNLETETSATFYQTDPTADATTTTSSISPSSISAGSLTYSTQGYLTGSLYDNFDSQFYGAGSIHNYMIGNIISSYNLPTGEDSSYTEAIDDIKSHNESLFNSTFSSTISSLSLTTTVTNSFWDNTKLYAGYTDFTSRLHAGGDTLSFDSCKSRINLYSGFDSNNKNLYNEIVAVTDSALGNLLTSEQFELRLDQLANEWESLNSGSPTSDAALSIGSIISVGLESAEFWRQHGADLWDGSSSAPPMPIAYNPNVDDKTNTGTGPHLDTKIYTRNPYYFNPIVALDIAGALVSAATNTAIQYTVNHTVKGKQVLIAAAVGAVSASTGLVTKVAQGIKWLWDLF